MHRFLSVTALYLAICSATFAIPAPSGPVDAILGFHQTASSNYGDVSYWLRVDGTYVTLSATGVASALPFRHAGGTGTYTIAVDPTNAQWTDISFDGAPALPIDFGAGQFAPPYSFSVTQFSWATAPAHSVVANTSARAYVAPGHPAIAGFVVSNASRTVVIRVVGPSLASFGVTDALAAPTLTLYRAGNNMGENKQWSDSATNGTGADASNVSQLFRMIGAFPLTAGSNDCLLVQSLQPGAYTVQAGSADGSSSGTVLIEAYFLP